MFWYTTSYTVTGLDASVVMSGRFAEPPVSGPMDGGTTGVASQLGVDGELPPSDRRPLLPFCNRFISSTRSISAVRNPFSRRPCSAASSCSGVLSATVVNESRESRESREPWRLSCGVVGALGCCETEGPGSSKRSAGSSSGPAPVCAESASIGSAAATLVTHGAWKVTVLRLDRTDMISLPPHI